ncbi:MAG: hypothetical protein DSO04_03220 [Hadesarchaea archaeon]|nr:MAG: hypothetical protein DSO04_03220 [Hadesarchaea archaeon]
MMEFEQLKDKILTLFREDQEFRYAIAGLLGWEEILRRLDRHEEELSRLGRETAELRKETTELRKEMTKLRQDMMEGFRRHDEEIAELRREMARLRQDMTEGFQLVHRQLSALGARWGLMSERAFREGLRGLLERELGLRVEKWARMDREGRVFGHPGRVEVDVAVRDGKVVLVEVKSHVGRADVYSFRRKAEFYEKVEGKKPSRLLMVTPYAEREALRTARHLGVEIYTGV